jgi:hypothetical protein
MADVLMQIERNHMDQTHLLEQLVRNTTTPAASSDNQHHGGFVNFLKTEPPNFFWAEDPLVADDWLRNVERKLEYSRCSENKKVLFASYLLEGQPSHGMRILLLCSNQIMRSLGRASARLFVLLTFQLAS